MTMAQTSYVPPHPQRSPHRLSKHILPRLLDSFGSIRSRRKAKRQPLVDADGNLLPLDGEEGELVDDEACFVEDVTPTQGWGSSSSFPQR
jgi:F-box and WD-40 domain protein 1/11